MVRLSWRANIAQTAQNNENIELFVRAFAKITILNTFAGKIPCEVFTTLCFFKILFFN